MYLSPELSFEEVSGCIGNAKDKSLQLQFPVCYTFEIDLNCLKLISMILLLLYVLSFVDIVWLQQTYPLLMSKTINPL